MVALTEHRQDQGRFTRMAQRIQGIGDDFGRLWLTIIGGLFVIAIAGAFAFAWNSNNQITTLTANSANTQTDVRDVKSDLRDIRTDLRDLRNQLGIKPLQQQPALP